MRQTVITKRGEATQKGRDARPFVDMATMGRTAATASAKRTECDTNEGKHDCSLEARAHLPTLGFRSARYLSVRGLYVSRLRKVSTEAAHRMIVYVESGATSWSYVNGVSGVSE